jgi:hypothetical protein
VPAPDFQSGERAFKPAETLVLEISGFSPGGCLKLRLRLPSYAPFDIRAVFCTLDVAAYPARRAGFYRAGVAELADAHGSGPCTRKGVGVRVPSSAPNFSQ